MCFVVTKCWPINTKRIQIRFLAWLLPDNVISRWIDTFSFLPTIQTNLLSESFASQSSTETCCCWMTSDMAYISYILAFLSVIFILFLPQHPRIYWRADFSGRHIRTTCVWNLPAAGMMAPCSCEILETRSNRSRRRGKKRIYIQNQIRVTISQSCQGGRIESISIRTYPLLSIFTHKKLHFSSAPGLFLFMFSKACSAPPLSISLLWMLSLVHYMIWLTHASMIGRRMSHPTKNSLSSSICLDLILTLFSLFKGHSWGSRKL